MSEGEPFNSIAAEVSSEIAAKGSKFICHAAPAATEKEAEATLSAVSAEYANATHNCFAYKIGSGDQAIVRFSDAGEPSGTAGRPMLQVIESKKLTNISLVVTRYFGGTKLGTGGLIRAYSGAALAALEQAKVVAHFPQAVLRLRFSYEQTNAVHQMLAKSDAVILESEFGEETLYKVQLKQMLSKIFTEDLKNMSAGKVEIEPFESGLRDKS